jgi:hypothetical protein
VLNIFAQIDEPQSCVSKSLFYLRIYFPILLKIVMLSIVKVKKYPLLNNFPTERSELFAMAVKKCVNAAVAQSSGMYNDDVWVESIVDPFGSLTRKGLVDFFCYGKEHYLTKNVLYIMSLLLQCPDVEEGVGYDKLETFRYYV